MDAHTAYQGLQQKTIEAEDLARYAIRNPEFVPVLIEGLSESKAEIKYGCGKALRAIVDEEAALLYPNFDTFADMLSHANKIFRWQAIYMLAGLAHVDTDGKLDAVLDDFLAPITGPLMITAANIIKASATLVRGKPIYADRVVEEVLRCEQGQYETSECFEVVYAAALKTFYKIHKWVQDPSAMIAFAERHQDSMRGPTARAAEKYLTRYAASEAA